MVPQHVVLFTLDDEGNAPGPERFHLWISSPYIKPRTTSGHKLYFLAEAAHTELREVTHEHPEQSTCYRP